MSIYGFRAQRNFPHHAPNAMAKAYGGLEGQIQFSSKNSGFFLASGSQRSQLAHSPDTGFYALFDGYISNRKLLIKDFNVSEKVSNAELFLLVFKSAKYSISLVIDGLYSAAIWDENKKELHLVTDSVGGAHGFYFIITAEGFFFASRLPSLLGLQSVPRILSVSSLFSLFSTGYILPPSTLLSGIEKTWPGQLITWNGDICLKRMPDPDCVTRQGVLHVRNTTPLEIELKKRVSDLTTKGDELGWLLSGGIDSGVLVSMAAGISKKAIRTFSAAFPGTTMDESDYARIIAQENGCDAQYIDLGSDKELQRLPRIIWELDEPFADYSVIPTYALFLALQNKVSAVVSGDGPDHLLGRYYPLAAKCVLRPLVPAFGLLGSFTRKSIFKKMASIGKGNLLNAYRTLFTYPTWGKNPLLCHELFTNKVPLDEVGLDAGLNVDLTNNGNFDDTLHTIIKLDLMIDGAFGVFSKVGKMARATGLEIYWPYLGKEFVDEAFRLPISQIISGSFVDRLLSRSVPKYILSNDIAPKYLSQKILSKQKGGFTPPLAAWLKKIVWDSRADQVLSPGLLGEGYFNNQFISRIFFEHSRGKRDWSTLIFMLISVDIWYNFHIEDTISSPQLTLAQVLSWQGK